MIDESILDEIFPVPELDDLKEQYVKELKESGFVITNFSSGGIFNILLMIMLQIRIEFIKLFRSVLSNMFVSSATGIWLELKAGDFAKKRKKACKTLGNILLSRETIGDAVKIPKGMVFKTEKDINGDELRFFSTADTILQKDTLRVLVPVEAEKEGAAYNVPSEQINKCLVHLEGIDRISNQEDWITQEGSDIEDIESLRNRTLNAWAELSTRPIADKYKSVCEEVDGVLYVTVNDRHPRGQGTVDIIVTSTAGEATESLLADVLTAATNIKGSYDDLLVKSAITVYQDITMSIELYEGLSAGDIADKVKASIINMFSINKSRNLNEMILVDIITLIKTQFTSVKNVKISNPVDDITLEDGNVVMIGDITVTLKE